LAPNTPEGPPARDRGVAKEDLAMMMRTKGIAAAVALGAALTASVPGVARADGGLAPSTTAGDALPPRPEDRVFISPEQLFSVSAPMGDAWARALHAVLDSMKQYVDQERLAAEKTVGPARRVTPGSNTLSLHIRRLAASRFVVGPTPLPRVRPAPLPYAPITYADDGPRKGEGGILPGIVVELPWRVP
jgi:hypothetical protein